MTLALWAAPGAAFRAFSPHFRMRSRVHLANTRHGFEGTRFFPSLG